MKAAIVTGLLLAWGLFFGLMLVVAKGAENPWGTMDPVISQWYQELMQPDNTAVSCCGEADAYWADSFEVQGDQYVAIITDERDDAPLNNRRHVEPGTRILIPNHKLKWDQGNPTGHGVVFLSGQNGVYCYVPPGGV